MSYNLVQPGACFFLTGRDEDVGGRVCGSLVILERVRRAGGDGTYGGLGLGLNGDDESVADRIGDKFGGFFLTGRGRGVGGGVFGTLITLERVRRAGGDGTDGGLGLGLNGDDESIALRSGDKSDDEVGVPCLEDGLADF